jgi:membrane-bound ClpP family serine protease
MVYKMTWMNWACVLLLVLGFILFLYGANYYNAAVGYGGIFFFAVGVVGILGLYIYKELTKKPAQNP